MKVDSISNILEKTLDLIGNDLLSNNKNKEVTAASLLLTEKSNNKKNMIESGDFVPFQSKAELKSSGDLYLNQITNSLKQEPKYIGTNNKPSAVNNTPFSFGSSLVPTSNNYNNSNKNKKNNKVEIKAIKSKRDKKHRLKGESYSDRLSEKKQSKVNKLNRMNGYKSSY